jgi:uncharacterized glyoxalase superfamily protein PhnB
MSSTTSSPRSATSAKASTATAIKASQSKSSAPERRSVIPHLVCANALEALEFYQKAFGAEEISRLLGPDGKLMHGAVRIGDSMVMLSDECPDWGALGPKALKGSPVTIHLYVDDVDAFTARAAEAGAKVVMPPEDMFWGDRYGKLEDPFGHQWSVATHLRDLSPEEIKEGMMKMCANGAPSS